MKYKGDLEGFPEFVVEAMLDEQEKQGNKRDVSVFEHYANSGALIRGFTWDKTLLGHEFWEQVIEYRNFSLAEEVLKPQTSPYYGSGEYEAINVIEAWGLNFNLGNVVKYIKRAGKKTPEVLPDLEKALWYIEREIKMLKKEK